MEGAPGFVAAAHAREQQRRIGVRIPVPRRARGSNTHDQSLESAHPPTFARRCDYLFQAYPKASVPPNVSDRALKTSRSLTKNLPETPGSSTSRPVEASRKNLPLTGRRNPASTPAI